MARSNAIPLTPNLSSRLGETSQLLAAMPRNVPVSSRELSNKTGMSPYSVGSLLRNANALGFVEKAGQRTEKRDGHWQVIPLWKRRPGPEPKHDCKLVSDCRIGLTKEDDEWMRYWKAHRVSRQTRLERKAV